MKATKDLAAEDARWARLRPLFRPGEFVLVRNGPVPVGLPSYQGPFEVKEVLGRYTFTLGNGQRSSD